MGHPVVGSGGLFGGAGSRRMDAQAFDAAVSGNNDLDAQAAGLKDNHFAGHGNAAFNLADQAAERCGFVVLAQIDGLAKEV